MPKFFVNKNNISDHTVTLDGDNARHIAMVLRGKVGDEITVGDGEGRDYTCKLTEIDKKCVTAEITDIFTNDNEPKVKITLFQGLPKAQKMDLIVQKGTELGISDFIPVITLRVDVKLKGEFKKLDRLNRIALEAAKQSKRSIVPKVLEPISFDEALESMKELDLIIVPYENAEGFGIKSLINKLREENATLNEISEVGIFIGPEGGIEEDEILKLKEIGAHIVTLGNRILRTETAGFTAASLIQYELGDLGGII
mgnify:CR=1 FL=1